MLLWRNRHLTSRPRDRMDFSVCGLMLPESAARRLILGFLRHGGSEVAVLGYQKAEGWMGKIKWASAYAVEDERRLHMVSEKAMSEFGNMAPLAPFSVSVPVSSPDVWARLLGCSSVSVAGISVTGPVRSRRPSLRPRASSGVPLVSVKEEMEIASGLGSDSASSIEDWLHRRRMIIKEE